MKRLSLLVAVCFALGLSACGDDRDLSQLRDGLGEGDRVGDGEGTEDDGETPAGLDFGGEDGDVVCADLGPDDCAHVDHCIWDGGEEGACYALEDDGHGDERACRELGPDLCDAREDCVWDGGEAGACYPHDGGGGDRVCGELGHDGCDLREDCIWDGGADGACYPHDGGGGDRVCGELGPDGCDLREDCIWDGGADGACYPHDGGGGDRVCGELGHDGCDLREDCIWDGGEDGACYPHDGGEACTFGCGDLGPDCCSEREDCVWEGGEVEGACVLADEGEVCGGDCIGQSGACCDERPECAWYMGEGGFCASALEPPCGEFNEAWCNELAEQCDWNTAENHCLPAGEGGGTCEGDCFGLSDGCCAEREACAWYMGEGGFCASAEEVPCGELNEPWCNEFAVACTWVAGEEHCFRADDVGPGVCEGDCWTLESGCCAEREACAWYMGEDGFCASGAEPPCGELNEPWCRETAGCTWHEGEAFCLRTEG